MQNVSYLITLNQASDPFAVREEGPVFKCLDLAFLSLPFKLLS